MLVLAVPALAAERVALVIGNARYAHAPRLANPLNDAATSGPRSPAWAFSVTKLENADQAALRQGLLAFTRAASAAEVAVVFLRRPRHRGGPAKLPGAGGRARLTSDQDVEFETVPLELVMRSVARASGLRLVILDACRENPVSRCRCSEQGRPDRSAAAWRGWNLPRDPGGLCRQRGHGGGGRRGAQQSVQHALLAHLEEPGLEVGLLFRKCATRYWQQQAGARSRSCTGRCPAVGCT